MTPPTLMDLREEIGDLRSRVKAVEDRMSRHEAEMQRQFASIDAKMDRMDEKQDVLIASENTRNGIIRALMWLCGGGAALVGIIGDVLIRTWHG